MKKLEIILYQPIHNDVNLAIYELLSALLVRLQDIQSKIKECL